VLPQFAENRSSRPTTLQVVEGPSIASAERRKLTQRAHPSREMRGPVAVHPLVAPPRPFSGDFIQRPTRHFDVSGIHHCPGPVGSSQTRSARTSPRRILHCPGPRGAMRMCICLRFSFGDARIHCLRECNVITIRIGDHERFHFSRKRYSRCADLQFSKIRELF
jgi:hypothetical protein